MQGWKFDLVVLGQRSHRKTKTALVSALREGCHCPIVSIRRPGQDKHSDADYSVDAAEGRKRCLRRCGKHLGFQADCRSNITVLL